MNTLFARSEPDAGRVTWEREPVRPESALKKMGEFRTIWNLLGVRSHFGAPGLDRGGRFDTCAPGPTFRIEGVFR